MGESACLRFEVTLVPVAMLSFLKLLDVIATCSHRVLPQTSQLENNAQSQQQDSGNVLIINIHVLQQVGIQAPQRVNLTIIYIVCELTSQQCRPICSAAKSTSQ